MYADFPVVDKLELYAGAGVGMAKHSSKVDYVLDFTKYGGPTVSMNDKDSNTCVAYNIQIGGAYALTDNIALDLGLRYADLGEVELGSFLESDSMKTKEAVFALRYTF